jgi:hypothetical protein
MRINKVAMGIRWGRLIGALELARDAMQIVRNEHTLLTTEVGAEAMAVSARVELLEDLVWAQLEKARKAKR